MGTDDKRRTWRPLAPTELGKRIGGRVRDLRRAAQLGQKQLAATVGVDVGTIGRLERGATIPSVPKLAEIAAALDVRIVDLFAFPEVDAPDFYERYHEIASKLDPKVQTKLRCLLRDVEHEAKGWRSRPW